MSYAERQYRLLAVSAGEKFIKEIDNLLPGGQYRKDAARSASEARCKLLENPYDLLIVNAPLADELGSRLCIDATRSDGTVAIIFVADEMYDEVFAAMSVHGVFVLHKPTSRTMVSQALSLMISARERLRAVEQKAVKAESKLDEARVVNKAKWLLIDHEGLTEADAHRQIEKAAMDAGVSKKTAAQIIIDGYF